eukprot:16445548-Heterocapsa_arctica.AAC.1
MSSLGQEASCNFAGCNSSMMSAYNKLPCSEPLHHMELHISAFSSIKAAGVSSSRPFSNNSFGGSG